MYISRLYCLPHHTQRTTAQCTHACTYWRPCTTSLLCPLPTPLQLSSMTAKSPGFPWRVHLGLRQMQLWRPCSHMLKLQPRNRNLEYVKTKSRHADIILTTTKGGMKWSRTLVIALVVAGVLMSRIFLRGFQSLTWSLT